MQKPFFENVRCGMLRCTGVRRLAFAFYSICSITDILRKWLCLLVHSTFMHGTTLANVALINENLNRAVREYRKIKLNPARYNEVLGVVIDLALDRVQAAYEALSLDDWIVREARVFGPALWLSQVHPSAEKIGVTGINRTMLSRFNEMASDIHGSIGWRETQAEHELPPNWEIGGLPGLAGIYRKRYPENSWLDRMTEDRLLMPNSVRELVRGTDAQTLGNLRLPRQWRLPSEKIILPLCIAHRRQPALLRSADFTTRCLSSKIRAMHLPPNEKSRAAARRRLMEEESSTIVAQALQLANVDVVKVDRLAEMRTLYPWHPTLCRLAGIFYCLAGDLDQAFPQLIFSVLIEPQGSANWMAIAKFAEFTTFPMMLRF